MAIAKTRWFMMIDLFNEAHRIMIGKFIDNQKGRLAFNEDIFKILEGNLKELLEQRMQADLGKNAFAQAKHRMAPINVFKKIVSKQTCIYSQHIVRTVEDGTESDISLLRWYEKELNLNAKLARNNFLYNAYLYSLLQITLTDVNPATRVGKPFVRSVPNHQFLIMSTSETNPTSPDVVIICMDNIENDKGEDDECYYVFTNWQFVIMNGEGRIHEKEMRRHELDGLNPYQTTPYVYNNWSEHLSMPMIQPDNREMSLLVPLLLTDLNYAVKFQAFSTFVATDTDDSKIELAPNAVVFLKSDGNGTHAPKFEAIKPTIDIQATLGLASSQMSLWLSSKGIRPGAVGQLGADEFSSGVSKMIDESDTYESVKEQIKVYEQAEATFWDKLLKRIHPFWVAAARVENTTLFTPTARVVTKFTQPKPLQSRLDLIKELTTELEAGMTTLDRAVRRLNPEMDEKAVQELIDEARAEMDAKAPPKPIPFQQPHLAS
jgi:hypothetical protein